MSGILATVHWDVSPEIFRIGDFAIRWYGLLFALAFYTGYLILHRIYKYEKIPVEELDRLTLFMIVGTVVGARLGHVLFYEPGYYFSHPAEIIKIWKGGLASHGGALGILVAVLIFSRRSKTTFLWAIDRLVIVIALAGTFIRTGNLMNSEIIGKPASVPWAFVFERLREPPTPRHPSQIYEALAYLAIFVFLLALYRKNQGKFRDGLLFGWFLALVFTARFILEFFKKVQVDFEKGMTLNMGQYLSIPFVLVGIGILIWVWRKYKSSGNTKTT